MYENQSLSGEPLLFDLWEGAFVSKEIDFYTWNVLICLNNEFVVGTMNEDLNNAFTDFSGEWPILVNYWEMNWIKQTSQQTVRKKSDFFFCYS